MLLLGMDTSTSSGAIALADAERLLSERILDIPKTHAGRLLPEIRVMLEQARVPFDRIDAIAVTTGPGSFTGLRIGLTTAKTLALVSRKPLVGIPTLDVLLGNIPLETGLICPVMDARRGEVYTAIYRRDPSGVVERLTEYLCLRPESLLPMLPEHALFLGDGTRSYGERVFAAAGHRLVREPECNLVRASVLCRLARDKYAREGSVPPGSIKAIYVRPSDAELSRSRISP